SLRSCESSLPLRDLHTFPTRLSSDLQLIDDVAGVTVASASTNEETLSAATKTESAALVGKAIAERGVAAGVKVVKFVRGGYQYHGRVQALADAARENGLEL